MAWPIVLKLLAVMMAMALPITPSFRDMNVPVMNPWSATCPLLNSETATDSQEHCYGTNAARLGGPYSLMWYWSMMSLGLFGVFYPAWNNLTGLFIIDTIIVLRLKKSWFLAPYSWIGTLFFLAFPQIMLTLIMVGASFLVRNRYVKISLLVLGPLLRFPIGAPLYVWQFIRSFSIQYPENILPYSMTVLIWAMACLPLVAGRLFERWSSG